MNLQLIGCSHHNSSVAVRERLAFTEDQVRGFLNEFYAAFPQSEAVLLSTCNRTELYTASPTAELLPTAEETVQFLAEQRGLQTDDIQSDLFHYVDQTAIYHLFSVAASLDSMVVGEGQILSQVKQAYLAATELNQAMPLTHRVFQSAIRVAKRVSTETKIHSRRVSIPSVAVGVLAKQIFERFDNKQILIIGSGKMARETLRYLSDEGAKNFQLVNRTPAHAQELAKEFGGEVFAWDQLETCLGSADLVVSTTGASDAVVTLDQFRGVESARQQRPLFILDLAIPRDFDPEIGNQLNVYLYTIDDLKAECDRNKQARASEWPKAERILKDETALFMRESQHRKSGSTIALLKQQAVVSKDAEIKRLFNRLETANDHDRHEIEVAFHRLVNKILHPPLESLRDESLEGHDNSGLLDALKRLFKLGD